MKKYIVILIMMFVIPLNMQSLNDENEIKEIIQLLEKAVKYPDSLSKELKIDGIKMLLEIMKVNPDSISDEIDFKQLKDMIRRSFIDYEKSIEPDIEDMKELLVNIIREPDSLTIFVKSSRFYDSTKIEKISEGDKYFLHELENPSSSISYIKRYNHFGYDFKMNKTRLCTRLPDVSKGETNKSKLKKDELREIAVLFKNQKIGLRISFIFIDGKYYYASIGPVTDNMINE